MRPYIDFANQYSTYLPASFNGSVIRFTKLLDEGCLVLLSNCQLSLQTFFKLQQSQHCFMICHAYML